MLRTKIQNSSKRAKTQKKQDRYFPQLKKTIQLSTTSFLAQLSIVPTRKRSQRIPDHQFKNKGQTQLKKLADENLTPIYRSKNSVKFSKKKLMNQFIMIQQIGTRSLVNNKSRTPSNVIDFVADQYQGQRDYNEDRILMNVNIKILGCSYNIFGVFDGHGGWQASQFVKNCFVRVFQQQICVHPLLEISQILRMCIHQIQNKLYQLSKTKSTVGGTCASILIIKQNKFYIAHVGDSRIISIQENSLKINQLTTDHKPNDLEEKKRIESQGGKIYRNKNTNQNQNSELYGPFRVLPGRLSVSRTLGDIEIKTQPSGSAITWKPQITQGQIIKPTLFLLFSDGAYERFSNQQIAYYFSKERSSTIRKLIQTLLINSIIRETTDNVSIIAVETEPI